jgi:hypothetical protein
MERKFVIHGVSNQHFSNKNGKLNEIKREAQKYEGNQYRKEENTHGKKGKVAVFKHQAFKSYRAPCILNLPAKDFRVTASCEAGWAVDLVWTLC